MRYKLPSGGKATMRDIDTLKGRHSKEFMATVRKAAKDVDDTDDDQVTEAGFHVTDQLIAFMVTDWEIPYPTEDGRPWLLPKLDLTLINELSGRDYAAVLAIVTPAREVLMPGNADPSDYEDLDSPTVPASA